jgi:hypothetical protein
MNSSRRKVQRLGFCLLAAAAVVCPATASGGAMPPKLPGQQTSAPGGAVRQLGTIKAIQGNTITLTTDGGAEVNVVLQDGMRMVRVEPGEKDLSHAVPLQLKELQPGDRILVRGQLSSNSKSLLAISLIAMKHVDIQAKQEQERADWQRRGLGGLVSAVDSATGTVTISVGALGSAKRIAIHTTSKTTLRRYAPDSVKFDDAKPAPMDQIKPGDQLRARGTRSADGSELAAEEIVSGTFRNIAGTISSIDTAANTMVVSDLLSKKAVTVRFSTESQIRKLPPEVAQGIAMRLKAAAMGGAPAATGAAGSPQGGAGAPRQGDAPAGALGSPGGPAGGGPRGGGGRDFQQVLNRLPQVTLADLQKGEAVILVSTEGTASGGVTAITLLGGVEPILTATPRGAQGFTLSPWSIGGAAAGEGGESNP